jgi:uncharacterized DUF497 family protein
LEIVTIGRPLAQISTKFELGFLRVPGERAVAGFDCGFESGAGGGAPASARICDIQASHRRAHRSSCASDCGGGATKKMCHRRYGVEVGARDGRDLRRRRKGGRNPYKSMVDYMEKPSFDWDEAKNLINQGKHRVSFDYAQRAFDDPRRVIVRDLTHERGGEERFFCLGKVDGAILTVRFSYRDGQIRIYGAGFWRKGKKRYERENKIF